MSIDTALQISAKREAAGCHTEVPECPQVGLGSSEQTCAQGTAIPGRGIKVEEV